MHSEKDYSRRKFTLTEGRLVIIAVVGVLSAFVMVLVLINNGAVRQVPITWQEKSEDTLAFRNVDGQVKVVGLVGTSQINPTIVMRIGDYSMVLTVINQDNKPHMLYIDGVNVSTKVLRPGQNDTIIIHSKSEATYNYYDRVTGGPPIGQIKAVRVTAYE